MPVASVDRRVWILPSQAARILDISAGSLPKVVPALGIRSRQMPGLNRRTYNRADVFRAKERIEKEATEALEVAQRELTKSPPLRGRGVRKKETSRPRS